MRITHFTVVGLSLVLSVSVAMAKDKQPAQMDMQAMMETYKKLSTPGEPHKQLASLSGSWTTKTKEWMDPSKPSTESTGTCEEKMLLDGRYLQQECTGEMMGQPYSGIGVLGYDNLTKKYVTTWIDSMGTGIFFMDGMASPDGKTITLKGTHKDPFEGVMKHRAIWRLLDANTQIFEMYGTGKHGKEMKMLEITYSRKQ